MKVLVVCSINAGRISTFISEQVESLQASGLNVEYLLIKGYGIIGYLNNLPALKRKINNYKPDLIHAHYGLSGLLSNLQRRVPVITTFHGSDINNLKVRLLSLIAYHLSIHSIFVSTKLARLIGAHYKTSILSCGVDFSAFFPVEKSSAREKMGLKQNDTIILFSGSFTNKVKNYPLARKALALVDQNIKLIELKGYSREQVNLLLNSCNVALLTSFSEGSPNFIKEAMACNCPVVSTDVGDVKEITSNIDGTYICDFSPDDVAKKLSKALDFQNRTKGREQIKHLEIKLVAERLTSIYDMVIKRTSVIK